MRRILPSLILALALASGMLIGLLSNQAGAQTLLLEGQSYVTENNGEVIRYQRPLAHLDKTKIHARELVYERSKRSLSFLGNLMVDSEEVLLLAEKGVFDMETKVMTLHQASLYDKKNKIFLRAAQILRLDEKNFQAQEAVLTLCDPAKESWSFSIDEIHYEVDNYAYGSHPVMRFYGLPVFYSPYLAWPTAKKRSSGFLKGELSNHYGNKDSRRNLGTWLKVPYFWAIDEEQDATFTLDAVGNRGLGLGLEYRWAFEEGMFGVLDLWGIDETRSERDPDFENPGALDLDPVTGLPLGADANPSRYKMSLDHRQKLGDWGQLFLHHERTSDNELEREYFEGDRRFYTKRKSSLDLVVPWKNGSLVAGTLQRETFLFPSLYDQSSDGATEPRELPFIKASHGFEGLLGGVLDLNLKARAHRFEREEGWSGLYRRAELEALAPFSLGPVSIAPSLGALALAVDRRYDAAAGESPGPDLQTDPDPFGAGLPKGKIEASLEAFRTFTDEGDSAYAQLTLRPVLSYEMVGEADQSGMLDLSPAKPSPEDFGQDALASQYLFDQPVYGRKLAKVRLELDYDVKIEGKAQNLFRLELEQRYDLKRLGTAEEIAQSHQGPQIPESLQETSPGNWMMPLLLDLSLTPAEGLQAGLRFRYGHEEASLLESELSFTTKRANGDHLKVSYDNNKKAYLEPDGSRRHPAAKTLALETSLRLTDDLFFEGKAHWNVARNALDDRYGEQASYYGMDVTRDDRSLTLAELGFTYRIDCYDLYLGYFERLYPYESDGLYYEALEKKAVISIGFAGQNKLKSPYRASMTEVRP